MDPYLFTLATPVLLCCMGVICVGVWHTARQHHYLLWQAANVLLVAITVLTQTLQRSERPYISALWLALMYLASSVCLAQSLAQRLGVRLPWRRTAAVVLASLFGMWYFVHIQPNIALRISIISLGMGLVMCLALPRLHQAPKRHALDHTLLVFMWLCAIDALMRPLLLLITPPLPHSPPPQHSAVWWHAIFTWLLLYVPYTFCLVASAWLDTLLTLRQERDHDALTGLLNRRAFEEQCGAIPYAQGFRTMVACDLDHFKRINDSHGHLVGDDVLRNFVHVLHRHLRASDVVARTGGEEFTIAFRDVDMAQAVGIVQRIAAALPHTPWTQRTHAPLRVTCSFGVVEIAPREALEQTMERADLQLYHAKNTGRNRIATVTPAHEATAFA